MQKLIYVFRTDVTTEKQVKKLTPKINRLFPEAEWNFDLEDCDNIFRMKCNYKNPDKIIKELNSINIAAIEFWNDDSLTF